jgi:hypothetical protein
MYWSIKWMCGQRGSIVKNHFSWSIGVAGATGNKTTG